MISMSSLYQHPNYQVTLENFEEQVNNGECIYTAWGLFKSIHIDITKNRCPICECLLDGSVNRITNSGSTNVKATIDHYRPQEYYPFLKCDDKNYILMCSECNTEYKKSKFPLFPLNSARWSEEQFIDEKPLIVNPIIDNLLEIFDLVFIPKGSGKGILELRPKEGLIEKDDYLYAKAIETIKVFGLGDCEETRHENDNIHSCRIRLLQIHYDKFYALAKARKIGIDEFLEELKKHPQNRNYGFTKFIAKEQFIMAL